MSLCDSPFLTHSNKALEIADQYICRMRRWVKGPPCGLVVMTFGSWYTVVVCSRPGGGALFDPR